MQGDHSMMRERSLAGAMAVEGAFRGQVERAGLGLVTGNGGHHWRFLRGEKTVLSYWPAAAKAQRPGGPVFRCRGHHAALAAAEVARG